MRAEHRTTAVRWLERALTVVGLACLVYYGYHSAEARNFHREQMAQFDERLSSAPGPPSTPSGARAPSAPSATPSAPSASPSAGGTITRELRRDEPRAGDVIAIVEIPRLKIASPVVTGDDADVLDVAIGHLPDTPRPWEPGNSALAAHRDGLFRSLRGVRIGDEVRVRSEHGTDVYTVRGTKVVDPSDLSVLAPSDERMLTLITCYPFNFIGRAPKRFIVHAELRPNESR